MGFNLNQNEKNRKETANLTNYANWLAQVNLGANYSNFSKVSLAACDGLALS